MNAEEKLELIQKIAASNDPVLLREIGNMIGVNSEEKTYELSDNQLNDIAIAEDQIKYGETMSHEDAKKATSKWLEK